jgi:hypothetical protein
MKAIKTADGTIIGYDLPKGITDLQKNIISLQSLSGAPIADLLPPLPEFLQIKELVAVHNLRNELIGFGLPKEIKQIQKVISQFKTILEIESEISETEIYSALLEAESIGDTEENFSFQELFDSLWALIYQAYLQNKSKIFSALLFIMGVLIDNAVQKGFDYFFTDNQQEQILEIRQELQDIKKQEQDILEAIKSQKSEKKDNTTNAHDDFSHVI